MKTTPTQAQERHDAIEVLRNQLRPRKAYEVTKPTAPSVNIIKNTINGREVVFTFYYKPSKTDMLNAHHATKHLENNLRDGVAIRKAHLFNLVENYATDDTDATINGQHLEQLKQTSEALNERE
jgi:hypothetical protein